MKKPEKLTPQKIWNEYILGENHHQQIELHKTVEKNEQFYHGEQWEGVNAPDLEKPVINVFKRAVTYLGSQIVSSDVGIHLEPFGNNEINSENCDLLNKQVERIIEITKAKNKNIDVIKDAAITGDGVLYAWFDPAKGKFGEIELENIDNEKLVCRNPFEHDIQKQRSFYLYRKN